MKNKVPVIGKSPISDLGAVHYGLVPRVTNGSTWRRYLMMAENLLNIRFTSQTLL